jgi:hypothetical protein
MDCLLQGCAYRYGGAPARLCSQPECVGRGEGHEGAAEAGNRCALYAQHCCAPLAVCVRCCALRLVIFGKARPGLLIKNWSTLLRLRTEHPQLCTISLLLGVKAAAAILHALPGVQVVLGGAQSPVAELHCRHTRGACWVVSLHVALCSIKCSSDWATLGPGWRDAAHPTCVCHAVPLYEASNRLRVQAHMCAGGWKSATCCGRTPLYRGSLLLGWHVLALKHWWIPASLVEAFRTVAVVYRYQALPGIWHLPYGMQLPRAPRVEPQRNWVF